MSDPTRIGPRFAWIQPESGPAILFDATIRENHENNSELTSHPVEKGSDVTDNVRHDPESYTIEGIVTNTPIVPGGGWAFANVSLPVPVYTPPITGISSALSAGLGALSSLLFGTPPIVAKLLLPPGQVDNISAVHNALTAIERSGIICNVFSSTKEYDSMIITSVTMPREKKGSAHFVVVVKRINVVETASVAAPKPLIKAGNPPKASGPQTPKPMSASEQTSLAKQAAQALFGGG